MFYLVHTIKETPQGNINNNFVVQADQEEIIKEFMGKYKLVVLWINSVQSWPTSHMIFGVRKDHDNQFKFSCKGEIIQDIINEQISIWLPLVYITTKTEPISSQEAQTLIQKAITTYTTNKKQKEEKIKEEKIKKSKVMDNKQKEKIIATITEVLDEINKIEQMNIKDVGIMTHLKQLHEMKEQLTKIKMWSNIEKATTYLEKTFSTLEYIDMYLLDTMKDQETKIDQESDISNLDVMHELENIKRANQNITIWANNQTSDLYYGYLWLAWLYQKFIAKDIIKKLSNIKQVILGFLLYFELALFSILLTVSSITAYHIIKESLSQTLLQSLMILALLNLTIQLPLALQKKSFWLTMIALVLAIVLSIVIYTMIINTFALL